MSILIKVIMDIVSLLAFFGLRLIFYRLNECACRQRNVKNLFKIGLYLRSVA